MILLTHSRTLTSRAAAENDFSQSESRMMWTYEMMIEIKNSWINKVLTRLIELN